MRTKTYPDSAGGSDVVTYTYNRPGQVTSIRDQAGLVHTYKIDALGRQTSDEVTSWGSSTVDQTIKQLTTGYDARGLVVSAKSFRTGPTLVNSVAFEHNGWRQLIEETQSHEGGTARTIVYGYATGAANTIRRISMTYPSGQSSAPVQNYIYTGTHANELSRVSAIRDGSTDIISYKWLGVGNPVDINYNVPATHLSYGTAADHYAGLDRFGRPISVPWLKDSSPALVHAQYRYDRSSNRQWRRDAAAHAAGVTTEDQWYEYDGLYQVGEFQRGTLSGSYPNFSGITPVAQNQDWNYDAMGNWLGFQNDALNQTRQFNKVNEITSINGPSGVVTPQYDPVGNMTSMPAVSNWTVAQTLKWDAWNRLVRISEGSSTIAEYTYDALFRRVTKTVSGTTRRFYYSDQWQILEEYVDLSATPQVRYWYGHRNLNDIARRQRYSSGTTLQDDLYALRESMNVVALVNTSSTVTQRMAYDAFGNTRFLNGSTWAGSANTAGWSILLHAHYRDIETGLYQMRFRYYHPGLGVWLSRDPIEEDGGINLNLSFSNNAIMVNDLHGMVVTKEECQAMAARPADTGALTAKILADIKASGCLPPGVICSCAKNNSYEGFYDPISEKTITIYICNIKDTQSLKAVYLHEITHAWQFCRNKDLKTDCYSMVCAEIQAYTTDGECAAKFPANPAALKDCIVKRVAGSAIRHCGGDGKKALQKASEFYERCSKTPLTKVV